jgi:hypothetical protein
LGCLLRHGSGDAWAEKKDFRNIIGKKILTNISSTQNYCGKNARVLIQTKISSK